VHTYAAGLVLAGGRMYEDGADLARGFGLIGLLIVGCCGLVLLCGGNRYTQMRGVPLGQTLIGGCVLLGVAAVGLVMMALGSSANGQL
jgi:hypothetical protein